VISRSRLLSTPAQRTLLKGAVPLVALSMALTACGGGSSPQSKSSGSPSASESSATPPPPDTWPLTGELVASGQSSTQRHTVLIAKIDNTEASAPQYGIGKADLVTEELVEGGITRLAVFFYSDLPTKVGPIRSMRLTDIGIAKPVGARLVTSGAAPVTYRGLKKAGVTFYDMNNHNVVRDYDHSHDYLHSVVADLAKLGKEQKVAAKRPADYMPWGTDADFFGTKPAKHVDVQFSGYRTDHWVYNGSTYDLTNSYFASGDAYKPDTVIACFVKTSIAPYKDPAGNPVPVSHFEGRGKAYIYHGGKVEAVTWVKDGVGKAVTFTDSAGNPVSVPAGHVSLSLVPAYGGSVSPKAKPGLAVQPTDTASASDDASAGQ
jgi:hypothetical protein